MINGFRVTGNTGKIFPHQLNIQNGGLQYMLFTLKRADTTPLLCYVFVISLYCSVSTANVMKFRKGHDRVNKNIKIFIDERG